MKIVVRSSLDVALWFNDRAFGEGEYIQPQKLHRLLYLGYAYFAIAYPRQKLMPACFVTDEMGPVEPTVYHTLAYGVPNNLEYRTVPKVAADFLDSIWRRFGALRAEQIIKKVAEHQPVMEAMAKGPGTEITYESIVKFYGSELAAKKGVPGVDKVMKPRVLKSSTGRAVTVSAWQPKPVKLDKDE